MRSACRAILKVTFGKISTDLLLTGDIDNLFLMNLIAQSNGKKPETFKLPKSEVLSRVKSFLPMMQAAEVELSARISNQPGVSVDIEDVKEHEEHVEMNISMVDNEILISSGDESESSDDSDPEQEEPDCMCVDEALKKCDTSDNKHKIESVKQKENLLSEKCTTKPLIEDITAIDISHPSDNMDEKDFKALSAGATNTSYVNKEDVITRL